MGFPFTVSVTGPEGASLAFAPRSKPTSNRITSENTKTEATMVTVGESVATKNIMEVKF
jgi:hypothetical protein